jgi:RES domain-containing protein
LTRVYRILRRKFAKRPFDGEGSYRFGGRWSNPGTRLSYASEHQSLAMLEYLVHLDPDDPPDDLVVAIAEVPDGVSRQEVRAADLPEDWRASPAPPALAPIGDQFVDEGRTAILIVPSVLVPAESNWLFNPAHADFRKVKVLPVESLVYDPRLLR